jgi:voltage-gated potassium channel
MANMPTSELKDQTEDRGTRLNTTYELFIIFLSLYAMVVILFAIVIPIKETTAEILKIVDNFVVMIFLYDFIRQLYKAPKKLDYLKWGWMDLISCVPGVYYLRFFRIGRIVRTSNTLRKETGRSVWETFKAHRAESALLMTVIGIFMLIVLTSIFVLNFEKQSPASDIQTPEDAVWWSFVTLTTVGYGDEVPSTTKGRFIGFVLMAGGLVLLAVFTGYAVSYFNPRAAKQEEILEELRDEMAEIKQLLRESQKQE